MLLVEHDMDVVFALADRLTVLDGGRVLASGGPKRCAPTSRHRRLSGRGGPAMTAPPAQAAHPAGGQKTCHGSTPVKCSALT